MNAFDDKTVDQTSWAWLNLFSMKPSRATKYQEGANYAQPLHNYLYNGSWWIDQVNEGALYTVNTTGVKCMDSLSGSVVGAGVFKVRRLDDPDNVAFKCCEITCTTADASIAATDRAVVVFTLEGFSVADLMLGTSLAETITINFKFKTNVTGVYGVSLANSAGNRIYATTFTVSSTSETEYSVTIPLDTSGTWLYTTGIGLRVRFVLAAGSTFQGTQNTWSSSDIYTSASQANFLSNTANICYIKNIQLVKGSVAPKMRTQTYDDSLRKCQRYFEKSFEQGIAPAQNIGVNTGETIFYAARAGATVEAWQVEYGVTKATTPTNILYNVSAANAQIRNASSGADFTGSAGGTGGSTKRMFINGTGDAGKASGHLCRVHWTSDCRL